jgi:monosaccharide-transporting ATPase
MTAALHQTPASSTPLLAARSIEKSFGPVRALRGVDFELARGQIHVLMGENGAGKSTLIKALSGVHPPDAGSLELEGRAIRPASPREAEAVGISTVFQEVNLIPHMTVAENITLGREKVSRVFRRIDRADSNRRAQAAIARLGVSINVRHELASCSIAHQQLVAIARALDVSSKVLILDEPTSSLDREEVRHLFEIMRRLRDQGMGIIFITHFLDQVYEVADRITVLRDGKRVGEYAPASLPRLELVSLMIGREFKPLDAYTNAQVNANASAASTNTQSTTPNQPPFLRASNLGHAGKIEGITLAIAPGDTLGLAGLLGSGRTETTRLLFGADRPLQGTLTIDGVPARITSPRHAIRSRIALTTEDRKTLGILPNLSVHENILIALQTRRGALRPIKGREAHDLVEGFIRSLGIKTPSPQTPIRNLSGGNQQKVLLARWLATDPRLLMLDEPTRGIDVGAKAEIEKLIESLRQRGMAVLLVGSDLEEIARLCARVIVLRDRRQVAELSGPACAPASIMAAIAAHDPQPQSTSASH